MRLTYKARDWITSQDGNHRLGICLGYDYCAEHEWGTRPLQKALGVDSSLIGLERFKITQSDGVAFFLKGVKQRTVNKKVHKVPYAILMLNGSSWVRDPDAQMLSMLNNFDMDRFIEGDKDVTFTAAWCDSALCIVVYGTEDIAFLERLHSAVLNHDVCLSLAKSDNPFGGTGLCLTIFSEIGQDSKDAIRDQDLAALHLKETADATGIEARLRASKNTFYALSPAWVDDSKTEVRFWLNPCNQDKFNAGWYSVADLDQWIKGKGPIVKNPKQ